MLFSNLPGFIQDATVNDNDSATVSYQDAGTHTASFDTHYATVTYALKAAQGQQVSLANGDANLEYIGGNTLEYIQQGQIVAEFQSTTSAAPNYLVFNNTATGNGPNIGVVGIDANAAINVLPRGTGTLHVVGGGGLTVDQAASITGTLYGSTATLSGNLYLSAAANWVATSNCGTLTSATKCLRVFDPNGNPLYLPAYGTY